ncbi:MAG: c-type cytochrome [Bacteroidia bacterium]
MKKIIFLPLLFLVFAATQQAQAQSSAPWVTPGVMLGRVNPLKGNELVVKDGKKIYASHCGSCHGDKGKGDGIASSACNPKPADHTSNYVQSEVDASLYWKISEGRGAMPSFKNALTEDEIWKTINYIRTLKAKK